MLWMPIPMPMLLLLMMMIDDENILKSYDFSKFEQEFKRDVRERMSFNVSGTIDRKKPAKEEIQVADSNRARNVLLTMKKVDMKNEDLARAIADLNITKLTGDMAEILQKCLPSPEEVASLQKHEKEVDKLTEADRFLFFLSKIDRCETKLKIMSFMGSFQEQLQSLQPQINSVITAASSIRDSTKLKKVFEIILAFGNYMNSAKRGGAYGFKLSALDRLSDTKSTKTGKSLLRFLVDVISKDFPTYNNFPAELISLEAASTVSLQTVTSDIGEIAIGLRLIEAELKLGKNKALEDFYTKCSTQAESIQSDFKRMNDVFTGLVTYFGEDSKTSESTEFFAYFLRFARSYQGIVKENELLAKQAEKQAEKAKSHPPGKRVRGSAAFGAEKGAVDDVINEIRLKGFRR